MFQYKTPAVNFKDSKKAQSGSNNNEVRTYHLSVGHFSDKSQTKLIFSQASTVVLKILIVLILLRILTSTKRIFSGFACTNEIKNWILRQKNRICMTSLRVRKQKHRVLEEQVDARTDTFLGCQIAIAKYH